MKAWQQHIDALVSMLGMTRSDWKDVGCGKKCQLFFQRQLPFVGTKLEFAASNYGPVTSSFDFPPFVLAGGVQESLASGSRC